MQTMLLVDSSSLIFRSYYATHYANEHVEAAIHLYLTWLQKLINKYNPDFAISAMDVHNKESVNFSLNDNYKADRGPIDKDLRNSFSTFQKESTKLGYNLVGVEGNEADDVIGSIVKQYSDKMDKTIVVSCDKDLLQLVNDDKNITTVSYENGGGNKIWHNSEVNKKFKIKKPYQVAMYKALAGDPSDNYKGVPGIGSKTASDLARRYGTIENVYKAIDEGLYTRKQLNKLMQGREIAFKTFKLAKLNSNLDIPNLNELKFNYQNK